MRKKGVTVLDFKLPCPLSNVKIGRRLYEPHTLTLQVCSNGSLSGYCRIHNLRVFIGNMMLVQEIRENCEEREKRHVTRP